MVYTAWKVSGFPTHRILGQAGALDVARFRTFLAMKLGCSIEDISSLLLGGHGDDMVPLPRFTSVAGIPIDQLLSQADITECVERAKVGGGEIVKLMGTSAYYAPASGTIQMVEAIVKDKKRIIPCAAYCEDDYGVAPGQKGKGYFVGVPVVLGAKGMEKVVPIKMTADESKLMAESHKWEFAEAHRVPVQHPLVALLRHQRHAGGALGAHGAHGGFGDLHVADFRATRFLLDRC
jgi:malate dehydrogenase